MKVNLSLNKETKPNQTSGFLQVSAVVGNLLEPSDLVDKSIGQSVSHYLIVVSSILEMVSASKIIYSILVVEIGKQHSNELTWKN